MGPSYSQQCSIPGSALQHGARCSTRTLLSKPVTGVKSSPEWQRRCVGSAAPLTASTRSGVNSTALYLPSQHSFRGGPDVPLTQSANNGISGRRRASGPQRQPALSSAAQHAAARVESAEHLIAAAAAAAPAASEESATAHNGVSPSIPAAADLEAAPRKVLHHLHAPSKRVRTQPEPSPSVAHPSGGTAEAAAAAPQQAATVRQADGAADEQPSESGFIPEEQLAEARQEEAHAAAESTAPAPRRARRREVEPALSEQPTESGVMREDQVSAAVSNLGEAAAAANSADVLRASGLSGELFHPREQSQIRESWRKIMRWSRDFKGRGERSGTATVLERTHKVVVFGGGSFGTAVGTALARQKAGMAVSLLLRDPYVCKSINESHRNLRYLADYEMPANITATTSMVEAIQDAQYAVHAVPVQHSRLFLASIKDVLPPHVPIICVSKGLEVGTGKMMSELIPGALGRKQPAVFLSGPSFAKEVMDLCPTGVVAACKDAKLAREVQELLAGPYMRVNTTSDVIGVEICGALKNVLAIAAGIVEGLDLGNNAMAALLTQGCSEIRWLAEKMGAKPATVSGLSGLGDIMLTCYGALSRNRSVGVRLGRGEALQDIISSSLQVAEGVTTAGVVVGLGQRYRVALPVLTAVAQVLDGNLSPREAVWEIMNLPQIEEN